MSDARIPAQLPPHLSWTLSLQPVKLILLHPFKNTPGKLTRSCFLDLSWTGMFGSHDACPVMDGCEFWFWADPPGSLTASGRAAEGRTLS